MGFMDIFKVAEIKQNLEDLQKEYEDLKSTLTPEMQESFSLKKVIADLQHEIQDLQSEKESLSKEITNLDISINAKKSEIISLDDEILVQSFGLYTPRFDFANALGYKEALSYVRNHQKELIKSDRAVTGATDWNVNGNAKQGQKMINDMKKLLLRAFNSECDELISKVKYDNYEASLKKIQASATAISKLGTIMKISIEQRYIVAKEKELTLAFEYQLKKQEEKETLKEARAQEREAAKLQKELDEQRKKIEKEQNHYTNALKDIEKHLSDNPDNTDLLEKKRAIEAELSEIGKSLADIDYREANQRAGYVYVISNIGSFGENVYKIGMTRRLDPQERVDELGDASVPFNFDIHAMIFSDDAPALEAALHKAFENKKVNMVNTRREFFCVTLDEIKNVIKNNFDKTVEFIDVPDAEQYRVSLKMKEQVS